MKYDSGSGHLLPITAPSVIESHVQQSFYDSGLGSSRPSAPPPVLAPSLAASSISNACSMFTTAEGRPSLPQIPKDHASRIGFTCPVCSRTQRPIANHRQWR